MSNQYYSARVCRNGHAATRSIELIANDDTFCAECGVQVIDVCPECGRAIAGFRIGSGGLGWQPDKFCRGCGAAYPWTSKEEMIGKIEDAIRDANELDAAEKVELRESLAMIAAGKATEADQVTAWKRIKAAAPQVWLIAQGVIVNVASAAVRDKLGV